MATAKSTVEMTDFVPKIAIILDIVLQPAAWFPALTDRIEQQVPLMASVHRRLGRLCPTFRDILQQPSAPAIRLGHVRQAFGDLLVGFLALGQWPIVPQAMAYRRYSRRDRYPPGRHRWPLPHQPSRPPTTVIPGPLSRSIRGDRPLRASVRLHYPITREFGCSDSERLAEQSPQSAAETRRRSAPSGRDPGRGKSIHGRHSGPLQCNCCPLRPLQ